MDGTFSDLTMYPNDTTMLKNSKRASAWNLDAINSLDLFSSIAEAQPLTPSSEDMGMHTDLDFLEFWYKNYLNYHGTEKSVNSMPDNSNDSQKPSDLEANELQEILNHVPELPSQLQQRAHGNRVNFIMIATTVDQESIVQQLGDTLERETFRAIPLSFESDNQERQIDNLPIVHDKEVVDNKNNAQRLECNDKRQTQNLKRKQTQDTAKEYRGKRSSQNRSVEIVRNSAGSHMSWLNTRTKELESDDIELEHYLKMFKARDLLHT